MKTDFKTANYFSDYLVFAGAVLAFVGLMAITLNLIVAVVLSFASVIILTTHYRLSIDFDNKVYHDYTWVLGLKHGERGSFSSIEYLFVKQSNVKQKMHSRGSSSEIKKVMFDGYLKFSDNKKIHVMSADRKEKLVTKLNRMAVRLGTRVIDYSVENSSENN